MMRRMAPFRLVVLMILMAANAAIAATDPLPSWREGSTKSTILTWLGGVTDTGSSTFIPSADRIAVFDNDGTSWCERPHNNSTGFQISLARSLANKGQIDATAMPFKAWFADDRQALREYGWGRSYTELNAAFAGMPMAAYRDSARAWLAHTRHERFGVTPTALYYTPMLELKDLLLAHGFQVWIVTGSAQDFVRSFSQEVLGIPPGRIIGTWTQPVYSTAGGKATLVRGAEQHYNGHENKPASIETRIGQRPVFAAGNSNNDEPMMRWTITGPHHTLALWIHHDDAVREFDDDRSTRQIQQLVTESAAAIEVSMASDWTRIFSLSK